MLAKIPPPGLALLTGLGLTGLVSGLRSTALKRYSAGVKSVGLFAVRPALDAGWKALKQDAWPLWLGGLLSSIQSLMSLGAVGMSAVSLYVWRRGAGVAPNLEDVILGAVLLPAWLILMSWFLHAAVRPGTLGVQQRALQGVSSSAKEVFHGMGLFGPMLKARVLASVAYVASAVVAAIPGGLVALFGWLSGTSSLVYGGGVSAATMAIVGWGHAWLGAAFLDWVIVTETNNPFEALERSWRLVAGHRSKLVRLALALLGVRLLGLCGVAFAGIGALVTLPAAHAFADAALGEAYPSAGRNPALSG